MKYIAALLLIITISSVFAVSESAGTCGMVFLKMDYSPSSAALGGAAVGYATGPDGLLANPASMAYERETTVSTSFGLLYAGMSIGSITAQREFGFGKMGLAMRFYTSGEMDRTDDEGNIIGSFGATDIAVSLAYSKEMANNLSVGIAPFFVSSAIDSFSALAIGTDFGALYKFDHGRGRVGFSLKNLGTQVSAYVDSTDPLPLTLSLGASYRLKGLPIYALAQGDWMSDAGISSGFGMELVQFKPLYLRVGYRYRERLEGELVEDELFSGLSAGFGIRYKDIWADYAFGHYGVLGTAHKFGIAYDGF